jgi:hypothetical protein
VTVVVSLLVVIFLAAVLLSAGMALAGLGFALVVLGASAGALGRLWTRWRAARRSR